MRELSTFGSINKPIVIMDIERTMFLWWAFGAAIVSYSVFHKILILIIFWVIWLYLLIVLRKMTKEDTQWLKVYNKSLEYVGRGGVCFFSASDDK